MLNRSCPFFTKSPSWKWTFISCPEICGLMVTLEMASTLPMACNCTGMVRDATVATFTGAAGGCCNLAACTESRLEHPPPKTIMPDKKIAGINMENSFFILPSFSPNGGHHDDGRSFLSVLTVEAVFLPTRSRPWLPLHLQERMSGIPPHQICRRRS